jgi:hypothetical protein
VNDIETQYDGTVEKSYRPHQEEGKSLKTYLISLYPNVKDLQDLEMISYHEKDEVSYVDDCIVCVYKKTPDPKLVEEFGGDPEEEYEDYYTIKYPIHKKIDPYLKVYSKEFQFYPIPSIPPGSCLGLNLSGIGKHYGIKALENLRDIYFFHSDLKTMVDFFGELYPYVEEDFKVNTRCYGIIYDQSSLQVLKVKRYIFPYNKGLFNLRDL